MSVSIFALGIRVGTEPSSLTDSIDQLFIQKVPKAKEFERLLKLDKKNAEFLYQLFQAVHLEKAAELPSFSQVQLSAKEWQRIIEILGELGSYPSSQVLACKALRLIEFYRADLLFRTQWKVQAMEAYPSTAANTATPVFEKDPEAADKTRSKMEAVQQFFAREARIRSVAEDRFRPLVYFRKEGGGFLPVQECGIEPDTARLERWSEKDIYPQESPGILQTSLENAWHTLGGLGVVVKGRHKAHEQEGSYNMWGYYPLYIQEIWNEDLDDLLPFGVISHWYNSKKVESSIWMSPRHKAFFVVPSHEECWALFDIPNAQQVYLSSSKATYFERTAYMGSSLAVFALSYNPQGVKSRIPVYGTLPKNVSIVLADTVDIGATAFELMSVFYRSIAPLVQTRQIRWTAPLRVGMLHGHANHMAPKVVYQGIGIYHQAREIDPSVHLGFGRHSDILIPVSGSYAQKLKSKNIVTSEFFSLLPLDMLESKMSPILNGLNPAQFDYEDPAILGDFASQFKVSPMAAKAALRQKLYEEGIIPDPERFVAVFVGRYAKAKGIFLLPAMAKALVQHGGQLVCLGLPESAMDDLEELEKQAMDPSSELFGKVKIYKKMEDQSALIPGTTIKRGMGIRAASVLTFMPSIEEPMGLVALEAMLLGSVPIVPCHEGFRDTCKAVNMPSKEGKSLDFDSGATAIMYPADQAHSPEAAAKAVVWAVEHYLKAHSEPKLDQIVSQIRQNTIADHAWYDPVSEGGVIHEYNLLYDQALANRKEVHLPSSQGHIALVKTSLRVKDRVVGFLRQIWESISAFGRIISQVCLGKRPLFRWRSHTQYL
jgi:glycogen synthase